MRGKSPQNGALVVSEKEVIDDGVKDLKDAVQEENDSQILEGAMDKIDRFIDLIAAVA